MYSSDSVRGASVEMPLAMSSAWLINQRLNCGLLSESNLVGSFCASVERVAKASWRSASSFSWESQCGCDL